MEIVRPYRHPLGRFTLHVLDDGWMYIDGGAMYGALPKVVWSRLEPCDELNRVKLTLRPLLVETGQDLILVETGVGSSGKEKLRKMFGVEQPSTLEASLKAAGFSPGDVTFVVNTHLHFDHAGGNTIEESPGVWTPRFPNATYVIHRESYDEATHLHERTRATILREVFVPLSERGRTRLVSGTTELIPGITLEPHRGHLSCVMCVRIQSEGQTAFVLSDVIPDSFHLPPAFIAGIDIYPMDALQDKKLILDRAARENWLLLFYHDPTMIGAWITWEGEKPVITERIPAG